MSAAGILNNSKMDFFGKVNAESVLDVHVPACFYSHRILKDGDRSSLFGASGRGRHFLHYWG